MLDYEIIMWMLHSLACTAFLLGIVALLIEIPSQPPILYTLSTGLVAVTLSEAMKGQMHFLHVLQNLSDEAFMQGNCPNVCTRMLYWLSILESLAH